MAAPPIAIEITESFVRLYVFLAQTLDRCLDQTQRDSFPEKDHQAFLAAARDEMREILRVNPVVKSKVEEESARVLALAEACLAKDGQSREQIRREREILKTKLVALSDLLALFRAL